MFDPETRGLEISGLHILFRVDVSEVDPMPASSEEPGILAG